jgi:transposase
LGSITGVYHGQHGLRTLQELAHSYQYLVADCTRIKNRIKAIFRGRGIACQGDAVYHTDKRQQWLAHLTELGLRTRALRLYAELDCLTSLRAQAEQEMIAEARKQAAFKLLDAIPTLGPVRVALILATMVTPHRFRTKRQLWTYSGFAVISRTSSDFQINNGQIKRVVQKTATRGLNENYNRTLKQVFKAAANSVRSGPLKLYYDGLRAQGMRDEMARLNVARKIATLTLTIWKKGVKFDPAYLQAHTV